MEPTAPSMKAMWLEAPEDQLDPKLKPIVERWDDDPTAIQILELLDAVVHGGGGSQQTVVFLEILLDVRMKIEKTTLEELVKQATWRD